MQINTTSITLMAKIAISRSSTISFIWKKEEEVWSLVVLSNHLYLAWLKRKMCLNQVARMIGIEWYLNERIRRRIEKRWKCQTIQIFFKTSSDSEVTIEQLLHICLIFSHIFFSLSFFYLKVWEVCFFLQVQRSFRISNSVYFLLY